MPNPRDRGRRPSDQGRTARRLVPSPALPGMPNPHISAASTVLIMAPSIAAKAMHYAAIIGLIALLFSTWGAGSAHAELGYTSGPRIEWEVKNRFRLFRNEADFQRHVAAHRGDGVLAAERRLARDERRPRLGARHGRAAVRRPRRQAARILRSRRRARDLSRAARSPHRRHARRARCRRTRAAPGASTTATAPAGRSTVACNEEVKLRVRHGRTTVASVDIVLLDGTAQRIVSEIQVRDVLIAGMGNSIAAGEGNPDRAVRAFRRRLLLSQLRRRASITGPGAPASTATSPAARCRATMPAVSDWARQSARWMSGACHRSLYGYQMRTALALAVENPHLAVTFIPLACTGATINVGFLDSQRARECPSPGTGASCPGSVRGQLAELKDLMATAQKQRADRSLDLVLLTVGANDIHFSGLVANIIVEAPTDRTLLKARRRASLRSRTRTKVLERDLPGNFAKLRARAQAVGRRQPGARRLRVLRQPGARRPRHAVPGRSRRLRRASGLRGRQRAAAPGRGLRLATVPAGDQDAGALRGRQVLPRSGDRAHDLRRRPPAGIRRARRLRPLERRSGVRSRVLLLQGRDLRAEPGARRHRPDDLRLCGERVPSLCAARALGAHRQRQLLHRDDLSGGPAVAAAADRPARRHLGHLRGGLWRRHPPERRGPRRDGRCRAAGGARGAGVGGAGRAGAQRAVARAGKIDLSRSCRCSRE